MNDPDSPLAGAPASAAYVPSKTALNSVTIQYAKELRKVDILVNAADPGYPRPPASGSCRIGLSGLSSW
jgi:NAD(P)-dependent dehydrogenase (short-subunit alcohol dehydrogenase family)